MRFWRKYNNTEKRIKFRAALSSRGFLNTLPASVREKPATLKGKIFLQ